MRALRRARFVGATKRTRRRALLARTSPAGDQSHTHTNTLSGRRVPLMGGCASSLDGIVGNTRLVGVCTSWTCTYTSCALRARQPRASRGRVTPRRAYGLGAMPLWRVNPAWARTPRRLFGFVGARAPPGRAAARPRARPIDPRPVGARRSSRPRPCVAPPDPPRPLRLPLLLRLLDLPRHKFRALLFRTSSWRSPDSASATRPPRGTAAGTGPVKRERGAIRMGLVAGWSSVQYYLAERDPTKKFGTLARFQNTIFFKTPLFSRVGN